MIPQQEFEMEPLRRTPAGSQMAAFGPAWQYTLSSSPFNWEQAVRVFANNWRFAACIVAVVTAAVSLFAFQIEDSYRPVARLELDPPVTTGLSAHELENELENHQDYLETQAQILSSDDLAIRVIRALHLNVNPRIVGPANLRELASQDGAATPAGNPSEERGPQEQILAAEHTPLEALALAYFQKHLQVNMVRNSRLIEVSFSSHDAELSRQVTNSLVSQFIDRNFKTRYESTMQASDWLTGQLSDLRRRVEDSNRAVADYQKQYGLVEGDDKEGPTAKLASELSRQLGEAQADRIQAEAFVRMIDAGQAQSLPQLRDNRLYETLAASYAASRAKLAEARAVYGEENTNYKKLANEVSEIGAQRDAEEARILRQVRTAYSSGLAREQLMLKAIERLKVQMGDTNGKMVRYRVLKNEAQATADLYNTLLGRLKEAGVYAGLKSSNIRVVDAATLLRVPTAPHRGLIISIGVLLSCFLSVALAFVKESLINTVRTPDDVDRWTALPSLAMIPLMNLAGVRKSLHRAQDSSGNTVLATSSLQKGKIHTVCLFTRQAGTPEAEALRSLRTSIFLSRPGKTPQVLLVASSVAGEGKSSVAASLAHLLAQHGKTCLVDADLRRPALTDAFGITGSLGLSQILTGRATLTTALVRITGFDNVCLLPVGQLPPSPFDLLASNEFGKLVAALRQEFAFVIIDSPPLIPFSDGRLLSAHSDGVLLITRYALTTRRSLARGVELLAGAGAPILGVVINGMNFASPDYHYYNYGYSRGNPDARIYEYYRLISPPPSLPPSANSNVPARISNP